MHTHTCAGSSIALLPRPGRANAVQKHFPSSLGADDFMQRVEMALYAFGFTGDNSIGEDGSHCRHACISSPDLSLSSVWAAAPIPPPSSNKIVLSTCPAAMVNLCRDEVTLTLKHRIEETFGSAFSTNGLGGVLTCGVTGMGAGFSHSPLCSSNKERYVFFSFPHIRWAWGSWLGGNVHAQSFCCCFSL